MLSDRSPHAAHPLTSATVHGHWGRHGGAGAGAGGGPTGEHRAEVDFAADIAKLEPQREDGHPSRRAEDARKRGVHHMRRAGHHLRDKAIQLNGGGRVKLCCLGSGQLRLNALRFAPILNL